MFAGNSKTWEDLRDSAMVLSQTCGLFAPLKSQLITYKPEDLIGGYDNNKITIFFY